ncbi:MAG: hypothetical protein GC181_16440 [Bacteroidetes bacterium]|nr:hypothetical protein [Bacteroidota bacterium]
MTYVQHGVCDSLQLSNVKVEKTTSKDSTLDFSAAIPDFIQQLSPDIVLKSIIPSQPAVNVSLVQIDSNTLNAHGPLKNAGQYIVRKLTDPSALTSFVQIESYASNSSLPYQLNAPVYTRVSASTNLNILGIPFTSDLYFTTEKNTFYNANSIGFHFNPGGYRENIEEKLKGQVNKQKKELKENRMDGQKVDQYVKDMENLASIEKRKLQQRLNTDLFVLPDYKGDIEAMGNDSLSQVKKAAYQRWKDSVDRVQSAKDHQLDSMKAVIRTLEQFIEKAQTIKHLVNQKDSVMNMQLYSLEDEYKKLANSKRHQLESGLGENRFISSIRSLDVGVCYPIFSPSSINGVAVKGLNITTANQHGFTKIVGGKTLSSYSLSSQSKQPNLFNRNMVATQTGYGNLNKNNIYWISSAFWDPYSKETQYSTRNYVNGIGGIWIIHNQFKLEGEILSSASKINAPVEIQVAGKENGIHYSSTFSHRVLDRSSINLQSKWDAYKGTQLTFKFDQKAYGFESFGSPFLRRNYCQFDLKLSQDLFRQKIRTTASYMHYCNNLDHRSSVTNSMKGLGIVVYSKFTKGPNFQFTHSPYQQGNNHSDTLLRTNNKMAVTNLVVTYQKTFRKNKFMWSGSISKAKVEYFMIENLVANTQIYNLTQKWETFKISLTTGITKSVVLPAVDSLNYTGGNVTFRYKIKSNIFCISASGRKSKTNAVFVTALASYQKTFNRNLNIQISMNASYLDQYWNMQNGFLYSGLLSIRYTINQKKTVISGSRIL